LERLPSIITPPRIEIREETNSRSAVASFPFGRKFTDVDVVCSFGSVPDEILMPRFGE
jgi:hypothetical protein